MATVKHPAFDHVTREVPDDQVDSWVDHGWVLDEQAAELEEFAPPAE